MTPRDLIAAFEKVAEAPDGVKRLRELVLQLAVRGKLVPQDPEDEPASVLLERIAEEKEALVASEAIRKPKVHPDLTASQLPFNAPHGWEWCRVNELGAIKLGRQRSPKNHNGPHMVPYLRVANVQDAFLALSDVKEMNFSPEEQVVFRLQTDDVLLNEGQSRELVGRAALYRGEVPGACFQNTLLRYRCFHGLLPDFILRVFRNYLYSGRFAAAATQTTNIAHLSAGRMAPIEVALPPLAEQHRIVARVDELMSLLDRLEAARNARDATREATRDAVLAALSEAETAEDMELAWTRFAERIDDLVRHPDDIKPVRQAVLELAVRGKLVPQDPEDEPASALFRRLVEQKTSLENSGQIKKQKAPTSIEAAEILFPIPATWKWVRAGDISYPVSSGSTPSKAIFRDTAMEAVPYLKVYNIRNQKVDFAYKAQFIDKAHHSKKMKRSVLLPGMVLLNIVGPPLGKTAIVPDTYPEWNCNQAIAFFRCFPEVLPAYLHMYFMAGSFLRNIPLVGTAGQDNLSVTKCKHIVVPLPPLAEQHRIVAGVDELMSLLDRLEDQLNAAHATHRAFASAAVHHLDA